MRNRNSRYPLNWRKSSAKKRYAQYVYRRAYVHGRKQGYSHQQSYRAGKDAEDYFLYGMMRVNRHRRRRHS